MKHPSHYDTDEATSKRMSNVKLKDGDAELLLARKLWHLGYRYKRNYKKLPGSPDIAITKYRIAIFVDGEFWHGYNWTIKKQQLNRNREYWIAKIEENIARDNRVNQELFALGWTPVRFWSKSVLHDIEECIRAVDEIVFETKFEEQTVFTTTTFCLCEQRRDVQNFNSERPFFYINLHKREPSQRAP